MKILIICPLTSDSGGAVTSWSISQQFAKLGHDVCFVERGSWKGPKRQAPSVRYLRTIDLVPFLPLNILLATLFNTIVAIVTRVDLVFALKPLPNSCIPAMIARLLGAKTILHINDLDYEFYDKGILKKISHFFYRLFPRFFDRISFPSVKLKEHVQQDLKLEQSRLLMLPQGVNWEKFAKSKVNIKLQEQLGLNNHRAIVYVASLGITANSEHIAELFSKITQELENIKFLVIGGGGGLARFKKAVHHLGLDKQITFTGFVSHEKIDQYLALGAVGVNYMEDKKANRFRVPIKVKEYLAAGLPVVTNNIGDYYLLEDLIGIAENDRDFVRQIKCVLNKPYKINSVGQSAVRELYDWKQIIQEFDIVIKQLVGRESVKVWQGNE